MKSKGRPPVPCVFKFLQMRAGDACTRHASYSAKYLFADDDTLTLELCSDHMPKAVRAAEIYFARKLHQAVKVLSVQFNEIGAGYKPRSESAVKDLAVAPRS